MLRPSFNSEISSEDKEILYELDSDLSFNINDFHKIEKKKNGNKKSKKTKTKTKKGSKPIQK